jgi:hypothetical protein
VGRPVWYTQVTVARKDGQPEVGKTEFAATT